LYTIRKIVCGIAQLDVGDVTRDLVDECRKIIHQNILLGINMQELKLEGEYFHQNNNT
jgi:hypothetical protein